MSFATRTFLDVSTGGGGGEKYNGTITCGYDSTGFPADISGYGFDTGAVFFSIGSRSPTTVSGQNFAALVDMYISGGYNYSGLAISGFGADPLTGFITSVTANGFTRSPSSYSYSSGVGTWSFTSGFSFPSFGTVAVTMIGS